MPSRIGIFGGAFNPVHCGHLQAALAAWRALDLQRVIFVPTGVPPFKDHSELIASEHRLAMLRLALAEEPAFEVSDFEVQRTQQKSYTIDTVRHIVSQHPADTEFFFLLGDDCTNKLSHWRGIAELQRLVRFACVTRTGIAATKEGPPLIPVVMPAVTISSTDIRARLSAHQSVRGLTPDAVRDYIARHALYSDALQAVTQEVSHGR